MHAIIREIHINVVRRQRQRHTEREIEKNRENNYSTLHKTSLTLAPAVHQSRSYAVIIIIMRWRRWERNRIRVGNENEKETRVRQEKEKKKNLKLINTWKRYRKKSKKKEKENFGINNPKAKVECKSSCERAQSTQKDQEPSMGVFTRRKTETRQRAPIHHKSQSQIVSQQPQIQNQKTQLTNSKPNHHANPTTAAARPPRTLPPIQHYSFGQISVTVRLLSRLTLAAVCCCCKIVVAALLSAGCAVESRLTTPNVALSRCDSLFSTGGCC